MPYLSRCLSALRAYLLTCQRIFRAHVLTSLACLRAHLPTCLACLRTHVPTCLACLRAHVPTCIACLRAHVLTRLACFSCLPAYVLTIIYFPYIFVIFLSFFSSEIKLLHILTFSCQAEVFNGCCDRLCTIKWFDFCLSMTLRVIFKWLIKSERWIIVCES